MSKNIFYEDALFTQRMLKAQGLYDADVDGVWGALTETGFSSFSTQALDLATELGTFDVRTEGSIYSLLLPAQRAARNFMLAVTTAGISARIISGTRSYTEQDELYKRGRWGNPGPKVTNARAGQSLHNFGVAWDIGIFEGTAYDPDSPFYNQVGQIGVDLGLEWGGNWISFVDKPHFQLPGCSDVVQTRATFESGRLLASNTA